MKDAKGHGSDSRSSGAAVASQWRTAHQTGVNSVATSDAAEKAVKVAKLAMKLYIAQAAAGAAVGGAIPWLQLAGIIR